MSTRTRVAAVITSLFAACAYGQPYPIHEVGIMPGDVAIVPAVTNQVDSHAAAGGGQVLVVWTDNRGRSVGTEQSGMDILGIRFDTMGDPIDAVPFVICKNAGWQQAPQATWNGAQWLVTFYSQDPTQFYYQNNIRGVRISPAGVVLDLVPLMLIDNEQWVRVCGQAGQWLITWYEPRPDLYGTDLVGRRLGGDGQYLDAEPVILMEWAYPGPGSRALAAGGEYLVVGQDFLSYESRARRVGFDGQPIGAVYTPVGPDIGSDGTHYLATWIAGSYQLRCSSMSADGVLANPSGAQLYSGSFVPTDISISHDGTNWFVGWAASQKRVGRVDAAGQVLDPGGVLIPVGTPSTQNTYNFLVVGNADGGALTTYNDYRVDGDANVYCIPLSEAAVPGSESTVSTGTPSQHAPAMAAGPGGQIALAFLSEAAGDDRILVHLLSGTGEPMTPEPMVVAQGAALGTPGVAWNGLAYMIVWNDTSVKARRLNSEGTFVDALPIDVMPGFDVDVAALGQNFCVIASRVQPYPQYIDVYYRRVDGLTGAPLDGSPILVGISFAYNARIHVDGDRWLATWERHFSHDDPQSLVQYAFIDADGSHTAEASVNATGSGGQPDVAMSGSHRLFVWRSNSLANANNYISGRLMDSNGSWTSGLFTIAEAPGRQLRPVVGWDGANFLVAWNDQRNQVAFFDQRTDIYGVRVSESGVVLDPAAFPIIAGPDAETTAGILSRTDGISHIASARFVPSPDLPSYRVGVTVLGDLSTTVNGPDGIAARSVGIDARPNPFNPSTVIQYILQRPWPVTLRVYDVRGRLVRSLLSSMAQAAGRHELSWDGRDDRGSGLPSGTYVLRLEAGGVGRSLRVALVR